MRVSTSLGPVFAALLCTVAALQVADLWLTIGSLGSASGTSEKEPRSIEPAMSRFRTAVSVTERRARLGLQSELHVHTEKPDISYAVFVCYKWNYETFITSLQTYLAAGWGPNLIIIDDSEDFRLTYDTRVSSQVHEVIPTGTSLTMTQYQNYIGFLAAQRNYTHYFWGHSDVAVLGSNATASFSAEVLGCMEHIIRTEPNWGYVFFGPSDWFAAVQTAVMRQVQWDPFLTHYFSDCDFYPRVRSAGFKTLNHTHVCSNADVKLYDLKKPLLLPLHDYQLTVDLLERERPTSAERNAWKRDAWMKGEDVGMQGWHEAAEKYIRAKWNLPEGFPEGCQACGCYPVEIPGPDPGAPRLRQKPFEGHQPSQSIFKRKRHT